MEFRKIEFKRAFNPENRGRAALFGPALFFLLIGVVTLLAPRLILAVVAAFFLFLGLLFAFVAWKFIQLKKQVHETAQKFGSQIQIQAVQMGDPEDAEFYEEEKKIVYH